MARAGRRRRGMLLAANYVRVRAINRGLFGESDIWRYAFYVMIGRRVARQLLGKEAEIVLSEPLVPGRPIRLEALDARTLKRERKALAAARQLTRDTERAS